jgi:hypothetical protein
MVLSRRRLQLSPLPRQFTGRPSHGFVTPLPAVVATAATIQLTAVAWSCRAVACSYRYCRDNSADGRRMVLSRRCLLLSPLPRQFS